MPELLRLKSSEQPALTGVHQAHDLVYLLVEGFVWVIRLSATDRADTVIGVERGFHKIFPKVKRYLSNFYVSSHS